MARLATEVVASYPTTDLDSSYNSNFWNLGKLIKQRKDISPSFIGPIAPAVGRPIEQMPQAVPAQYPWVVRWSSNIDWIFFSDGAGAAATRRIQMWEFNRSNSSLTPKGYCTLIYPNATNHTIAGFRMTYDTYAKGQITGTGKFVTGYKSAADSSAAWVSDRICSGSRIGFGTSDPTKVSTWYTIGSVVSDNFLSLTSSLSSPISTSTNYVIEDLRAYTYNTNATITNGGLYVAKGLSYADFPTNSSTFCPSCNTTVDCSRYVYWLRDGAAIQQDTSAAGLAFEPKLDWDTHYAYGLNLAGVTGASTIRFFKYNLRAPLTIITGTGSSFSAIDSCTATSTITPTLSRINNGRWATLKHGPLQDASAVYFVSGTRVYGVKTADIAPNALNFSISAMNEVPPGSTTTFAATGALNTIEHSDTLDRLIVMTTGATAFRSYVTQFRTDAGQMDHIFLTDDRQLDQSTVDANTTPHPSTLSLNQMCWMEGGNAYFVGIGTTATTNIIHTAPLGVEWTYSSSTNTVGQLISPKLLTPNCNRFIRVYAVRDNMLGNDILGKRTDAMRVKYRTAGIDDNSGSWTLVTEPNDLSGVTAADAIQFLVEFKGITDFCVPARLMVLGVVYEDNTTDSHFQPSVRLSDYTNKYFAWRFATAFGSSPISALKIVLTDAALGTTLLTDYTDVSTNGSWQVSYNLGSNWIAYDSSDKTNENHYIRYVPTSLADNIKVKASLLLK